MDTSRLYGERGNGFPCVTGMPRLTPMTMKVWSLSTWDTMKKILSLLRDFSWSARIKKAQLCGLSHLWCLNHNHTFKPKCLDEFPNLKALVWHCEALGKTVVNLLTISSRYPSGTPRLRGATNAYAESETLGLIGLYHFIPRGLHSSFSY